MTTQNAFIARPPAACAAAARSRRGLPRRGARAPGSAFPGWTNPLFPWYASSAKLPSFDTSRMTSGVTFQGLVAAMVSKQKKRQITFSVKPGPKVADDDIKSERMTIRVHPDLVAV